MKMRSGELKGFEKEMGKEKSRSKIREFGKHFLDKMKNGVIGAAFITGVAVVGASMLFSSCQESREEPHVSYWCKFVNDPIDSTKQEDAYSSEDVFVSPDQKDPSTQDSFTIPDQKLCKHEKVESECSTIESKTLIKTDSIKLDNYSFTLQDCENDGDKPAALVFITNECGEFVSAVKISEGESEEITIDGVTYVISAKTVGCGDTWAAIWADLSISVKCSGENITEDIIESEGDTETITQGCINYNPICEYSLQGGKATNMVLDNYEAYTYTETEEFGFETTEGKTGTVYTITFDNGSKDLGIPQCPPSGAECENKDKSSNHKLKIKFAGEMVELLAMNAPTDVELTDETSTVEGGNIMLSRIAESGILHVGESLSFAGYLFKLLDTGDINNPPSFGIYTDDGTETFKGITTPQEGSPYQYAVVDEKQFELYVYTVATGNSRSTNWVDTAILSSSMILHNGENMYEFQYGGPITFTDFCAKVTLTWKNKSGNAVDTQPDSLREIRIAAKCD